jgi:hypothetical protein
VILPVVRVPSLKALLSVPRLVCYTQHRAHVVAAARQVALLLARGARLDAATTNRRETALFAAARGDQADVVTLLCARGNLSRTFLVHHFCARPRPLSSFECECLGWGGVCARRREPAAGKPGRVGSSARRRRERRATRAARPAGGVQLGCSGLEPTSERRRHATLLSRPG